ncbi:MAG: methyltransferase domain-containing protein, partial [Actinobacteria bacterium]|nr:methyltransferase domain-containing protein [Actinomycetota bacterium]
MDPVIPTTPTQAATPQAMPPPREGDPHRAIVDTYLRHADDNRIVGQLPPDVRLGGAKRLLLRLLRFLTRDQTAFNIALLTAVEAHIRSTDQIRVSVDQRLSALETRLSSLEDALSGALEARASLEDALGRTASDVAQLQEALRDVASRAELEQAVGTATERVQRLETAVGEARRTASDAVGAAADRTEVAVLRHRVDMLLKEARSRLPGPFDDQQLSTFAEELAGRLDAVYADFQDSFRGSVEEIRDRVRHYLPDISALHHLGEAPVVDLGSGRGEWLDVLRDAGVRAYGIDTNDTFIERCTQRGLEVVNGDAVLHLMKEVEHSSVKAVTGFHIVEHISFESLLDVIDASLRALRPGGCVIFETPNPTNLTVGAAQFYLDPTHQKPLHPHLMEFLLASRGFVDVEIRFLHPVT